jgi:hypothetical protein
MACVGETDKDIDTDTDTDTPVDTEIVDTDVTEDTDDTDDTDVEIIYSFETDVQYLFARSCTTAGCHGGPEYQTGLDLSTEVAWSQIVGVPSVQLPSMNLITPNDPANSYLLLKGSGGHSDAGGSGNNMPPGLGMIQSEQDVISGWIEQGALDN